MQRASRTIQAEELTMYDNKNRNTSDSFNRETTNVNHPDFGGVQFFNKSPPTNLISLSFYQDQNIFSDTVANTFKRMDKISEAPESPYFN